MQEIEDLRLILRDSSRNRTFIRNWPQAVEKSNEECKKYLFRQHDPDSFEDQDKKKLYSDFKDILDNAWKELFTAAAKITEIIDDGEPDSEMIL
ncbi:hypothetical protein [Candidatus Finniella inopinata]|uniref:Uncharacterized protein n=1 Tax=Candidatus Finniella inopinata TaxID=1696036 RepID=A0A4Q7DHP6_9PROT|nr:hypothetical protein [Candidatus Finniella inopinata]RZI45818.1 hypothetical protein EQU50_05125 [Candidatus Finniella inopinata]